MGAELASNANILHAVVGLTGEALQTSLVDLLDSARPRPPTSNDLLSLIEAAVSPDGGEQRWQQAQAGYLLTAVGQLYQYATILQIFDMRAAGQHAGDRLKEAYGDGRLLETFDILATSRSLLAVDSRLGWLMVSSFRIKWGLQTYDMPAGSWQRNDAL